jgi:hypothetical protein
MDFSYAIYHHEQISSKTMYLLSSKYGKFAAWVFLRLSFVYPTTNCEEGA